MRKEHTCALLSGTVSSANQRDESAGERGSGALSTVSPIRRRRKSDGLANAAMRTAEAYGSSDSSSHSRLADETCLSGLKERKNKQQ